MEPLLYSVRMRASAHGRHLSGAERIVPASAAGEAAAALTQRAMLCPGGPATEVHCSLERIDPARLRTGRLPDISTYQVDSWRAGRRAAKRLLVQAGVSADVAGRAVDVLAKGAGPGGKVMRGAVIMDAATGERLESDPARGVRVSRMDLSAELRPQLERALAAAGLAHPRVLEALVLAGKVLQGPGMVAELCWSDDPAYATGYVADPRAGYQRITAMKPAGDLYGGRVFFVNRAKVSLTALFDYLESQAVMFTAAGAISPPVKWEGADD
jgi:6-carboxyhexanoate--CoA ligase